MLWLAGLGRVAGGVLGGVLWWWVMLVRGAVPVLGRVVCRRFVCRGEIAGQSPEYASQYAWEYAWGYAWEYAPVRTRSCDWVPYPGQVVVCHGPGPQGVGC